MTGLIRFKNRMHAGQLLAERLADYAGRGDVVVLALPRGGVPVGYAVALALAAPLDILLVHKLGMPGHEEYAIGAVASGGYCMLQDNLPQHLKLPQQALDAIVRREVRELRRREQRYRANFPAIDLAGRQAILVDDGVATGSTILTAIHVLREARPARIIAAVPVAPPESCLSLRAAADESICLLTPESFRAVGQYFENFAQISDDEVTALLAQAQQRTARPAPNLQPGSAIGKDRPEETPTR